MAKPERGACVRRVAIPWVKPWRVGWWAVIQIQADYPLGDASLVSCVHEETRAAGLWAKFERTTVTQRVHDGALVMRVCAR